MRLTDAMLKQIYPHASKATRDLYLPHLNNTALAYDINNELRMSAWLATLGQESGELRWMQELASGDAYDTRTDLGNTPQRDGDGRLYKGHGGIQITGKTNHRKYSEYLKEKGHLPYVDFVKEPKRLAELPYCIDSAGWFFAVYIKANPLADLRKFLEIQLRVNGGRARKPPRPNHWNERVAYYERALRVLPDDFALTVPLEDNFTGVHFDARLLDTEAPDYLDAPVSSEEEWQEGVRPAPEPETGITHKDTAGNGTSASENKPIVEAGAAENATPEDKARSPQVVVKETPSIFTKVMTGILGSIASAIAGATSFCGGNEVVNEVAKQGANRAVENATRNDVTTFGFILLWIALGLGIAILLFWIAAKIWDKAAQRAHELNVEKVRTAADPTINTVEFVKK